MVVIADTGVLISLGYIGQISLISKVLGDFFIPEAVWAELLAYKNPDFTKTIFSNLVK